MDKLNPIPVYRPFIDTTEVNAVTSVVSEGWISSRGTSISQFEDSFSEYTGFAHASTVSNGTVAIELAMKVMGVDHESKVIVPTLTYVASASPALHLGAHLELVDVDPRTWLADFTSISFNQKSKLQVLETVDLFGNPYNFDSLCEQRESGFIIMSDSAESCGSFINGVHAGKGADITTFSFFGNKTITTGEGGMVCTDSSNLDLISRKLKNQGLNTSIEYFHDVKGHNFRMTNIQAAIGMVQLNKIQKILSLKREIYNQYNQLLDKDRITRQETELGVVSSYWMCSFLAQSEQAKKRIREKLREHEIETRPFFTPLHQLPFIASNQKKFPVAEELWRRGFSLPSWPGLSNTDILRIVTLVNEVA